MPKTSLALNDVTPEQAAEQLRRLDPARRQASYGSVRILSPRQALDLLA